MKKNRVVLVFYWIVTFVIVAVGLWFYNGFLGEQLRNQTGITLSEIMEQQRFNFDSKLRTDEKMIRGIAKLFDRSKIDNDSIIELLSQLTDDSDFDNFAYAKLDGQAIFSDGSRADLSDREYFIKAKAGKTNISDPILSKVRGVNIIAIATPVYNNQSIIGVLIGSFKSDELNKLFLGSFNGEGYAYITDEDGNIIAKSTNTYSLTSASNLFNDWANADFYRNDDLETIKANLKEHKGGHSRYELYGQKRYMHYAQIEINGWNIFSIVPEQAAAVTTNIIAGASLVLTALITLAFFCFLIYNIYSHRRHIDEIERIAFYDELTGVPTLAKFKLDAAKILKNNPNKKYILVKSDIDNFKLVNQALGFSTGDRVLCGVALAFAGCIRSDNELVARTNVDEFVFLHEYSSDEEFLAFKDRFFTIFKEQMGENFDYKIKLVAGHYRLFIDSCTDINSAFEYVNIAHRKAKQEGIAVCEFDQSIMAEMVKRNDIENRMEMALIDNEFMLFLQPKYSLKYNSIAGAEALVRWRSEGVDIVYPGSFIPLFEENGFITKLDMYMLKKVCKLIKDWMDDGIDPITISVNFSRNHLYNEHFIQQICDIVDSYSVPHSYIEIELLESTMFENEAILLEVLSQLHEAGFTLSMDDFGSGYSSLGLLKNIPVDVLKIDRSFFDKSMDSKRAVTVIGSVMEMAKRLDIKTVAEGVETKEQVDMLSSIGCDMVQGYYFARPMPYEEFSQKLNEERGGV